MTGRHTSPPAGPPPVADFRRPWLQDDSGLFEGGYSQLTDPRYQHPADTPTTSVSSSPGAAWSATSRGAARVGALSSENSFYTEAKKPVRHRGNGAAGVDHPGLVGGLRRRAVLRILALLMVAPVLVAVGFTLAHFTGRQHPSASIANLDAAHVVDADDGVTLQVRVPRAATAGESYDLLVPSGFHAQAPDAGGGDVTLISPARGVTMVTSSHSTQLPPIALSGRAVHVTISGVAATGVRRTSGDRTDQVLRFEHDGVRYEVDESVPTRTAQQDLALLDRVLLQWRFVRDTD